MTDAPLSRRDLARALWALAEAGETLHAAADTVGVSRSRARRIAIACGIRFGGRGRSRRVAARVPLRTHQALGELARIASRSPSAMVAAILAEATEAGLDRTRQRLGKAALPTRSYRRREDGSEA